MVDSFGWWATLFLCTVRYPIFLHNFALPVSCLRKFCMPLLRCQWLLESRVHFFKLKSKEQSITWWTSPLSYIQMQINEVNIIAEGNANQKTSKKLRFWLKPKSQNIFITDMTGRWYFVSQGNKKNNPHLRILSTPGLCADGTSTKTKQQYTDTANNYWRSY